MSDNISRLGWSINGDDIAADKIAGAKHPRVKITLGNNGSNDGDVSATNPLPVSITEGITIGDITVDAGHITLDPSENHIGNIGIDLIDSPVGDAYGRMRVSQPEALFEVTHEYDLAPRLMGLQKHDAGTTITHVSPVVVLAVPTTAGRRICHQSHRYCIYQPGKSQIARLTGQLGDGTILAGMGYGDDDDGIFLERTDTGLQIRFSSSIIDSQVVAQTDWNVDKFDGNGPSGLILDPDQAQQIVIDCQWLGVGRARFGFGIDGRTYYAHSFNFANTIPTVYMRTGTLPIRWYAESIGAAGSMTVGCASVSSEGGTDPQGQMFSYATVTPKTLLAAGTRTPLISIRPALIYNALDNHGQIIPANIMAIATSADNVLLEWISDATLTGATYAVPLDSRSHAQIDTAATAISGGRVIWADYVSSQTRASIRSDGSFDAKSRLLTVLADGVNRDTLTLCGTRIAGAVSTLAGLTWVEIQ